MPKKFGIKGIGQITIFKKDENTPILTMKDIFKEKINDELIVGYDPSNDKDYSVTCYWCSNCGSILHAEAFQGEEPKIKEPKECKVCGTKFTNVRRA